MQLVIFGWSDGVFSSRIAMSQSLLKKLYVHRQRKQHLRVPMSSTPLKTTCSWSFSVGAMAFSVELKTSAPVNAASSGDGRIASRSTKVESENAGSPPPVAEAFAPANDAHLDLAAGFWRRKDRLRLAVQLVKEAVIGVAFTARLVFPERENAGSPPPVAEAFAPANDAHLDLAAADVDTTTQET
jgi:hypothetical protein